MSIRFYCVKFYKKIIIFTIPLIPSKNKRYVAHGSGDAIKTALKSVFEFLLGDDALMLRIEIGDDVRLLLFRLFLQEKLSGHVLMLN